jgi:hypothetical protein
MSLLEVVCPQYGRANSIKGGAGFQKSECQCGSPLFVFVESGGVGGGRPGYTLMRFEIEPFSRFLKETKKPVETFNVKTGLLYSGCDRAYVLPTGKVDAMPMAKAKVYKWIQEFLMATGR